MLLICASWSGEEETCTGNGKKREAFTQAGEVKKWSGIQTNYNQHLCFLRFTSLCPENLVFHSTKEAKVKFQLWNSERIHRRMMFHSSRLGKGTILCLLEACLELFPLPSGGTGSSCGPQLIAVDRRAPWVVRLSTAQPLRMPSVSNNDSEYLNLYQPPQYYNACCLQSNYTWIHWT